MCITALILCVFLFQKKSNHQSKFMHAHKANIHHTHIRSYIVMYIHSHSKYAISVAM